MKFWASFGLRSRILFTLGTLVLITVAGGVIMIWYTYRMEVLLTSVIRTNVASLQAAKGLEIALLNQRGYVSYYLLDGNPDWLKELGKHRRDFVERINGAREIDRSEATGKLLDRIESEYSQYTGSKDRVIEFYKNGKREAGSKLHRQVRGRFFDIYELCEQYKDIHNGRLILARSNSRAQAVRLRVIATASILAIVAVGVLLTYVLLVQFLNPIRRLVIDANRAGGSFQSGDEVTALQDGVHGLIKDVDQAYMELEEKERKYRGIFESAADSLLLIDPDGTILDANPAALSTYGFSREEFMEGNFRKIIPPEYLDFFNAAIEETTGGRSFFGESEHMRRDGASFPVEIRLSPTLHKGTTAILAALRDITKRKQAERVILEEKAKAEKYLDIARVIFIAVDADEKVTLVNKRGCEILGYEEGEIIGKNWFDNFLPQRFRGEVRGVFRMLMAGEVEAAEYVETIVLNKSNEERTIAWHNSVN